MMHTQTDRHDQSDSATIRADHVARVRALAEALHALPLCEGFTIEAEAEDHYEMTTRLLAPHGWGIRLQIIQCWRAPRLEVSGVWPRTETGKTVRPPQDFRITVDPQRPTAALCREIQRRFLALYLGQVAAVLTRMEQANAQHRRMIETGFELASRLGITFDPREIHHDALDLRAHRPEFIRIVTYDGAAFKVECTITSRATLDTVIEALRTQ